MSVNKPTPSPNASFATTLKSVKKVGNYLLLGSALLGGSSWVASQQLDKFTRQQTVQAAHYAIHPQEESSPTPKAIENWIKQDLAKQGVSPQELQNALGQITGGIREALGDWELGQLSSNMLRDRVTMADSFNTARDIIKKYSANPSTQKVMINQLQKIQSRYETAQPFKTGAVIGGSLGALTGIILHLVAGSLALSLRKEEKTV